MPHARIIKPSFFTNEQLGGLSTAHRLLFIGLWCLADREGKLEDRPARIRAELFPFDDGRVVNIPRMIADLAATGLIRRYNVNDSALIWIPGFNRHQHPHRRESKSTLPSEPKDSPRTGLYAARTGLGPPDPVIGSDRVRSGSPPVVPPTTTAPAAPSVRGLPFDPEEQPEPEPRPAMKKGSWEELNAHLDELKTKHPGVDVEREMDKYSNWLASTGRKTRSHLARFRNWLLKAEEDAQSGRAKTPQRNNRRGESGSLTDEWDAYARGED